MAGDAQRNCDYLIVNGYVITVDGQRRVFPSGAVAVDGNRILEVGPEAELRRRLRPRHVIDAGGAAVHPGLIDAHYHATLHTTRGAVTDDPNAFADLGDRPHPYAVWFNKLRDEDEYASCRHAAAEMLLNGHTCMVEAGTVFEPDICAEALTSIGLRASLSEPFLWDVTEGMGMTKQIERAPCNGRRAGDLLGSQLWRNDDPDALVRGHVSLYGMGTASDELTLAAKRVADQAGVTFCQHQSLEPGDAGFDDRRFGAHPLVHFAEIGALGPNATFVHMNVLREDERNAVVDSGMSVVWHPGNYQFYGIARAQRSVMPALAARGVNLCFGTDAAKAWTFGELPRIGYLVAREEGAWLPCETILEMQTINAARATGLDGLVGSLEPGKRADIVIRDANVAEAQPALDVIREMTLVCPAKSVDTVMVDGHIVVRHHRLVLADEQSVYAAARESARRVAGAVGLSPGTVWPCIE